MVTVETRIPALINKAGRKNHQEGGKDPHHDDIDQLIEKLPREKIMNWSLILHEDGFWCPERLLRPLISFQRNYDSKDNDILLATMPKSGTTWLKALAFSIVNRDIYSVSQSPLHTSNPHELVPFEFQLAGQRNRDEGRDYHVFATHMPYASLPDSIFSSKCKIVYLCRNPLDQFVSDWHFHEQMCWDVKPEFAIEDALDLFLQGKQNYGPFWEQIQGYWNASLKFPGKVLFIKYEDLKKDCRSVVKRIAQFLQMPFAEEEEKNGLVEQIVKLCSFESLSNMEVNKPGKWNANFRVSNNVFFRKGEVGDWINYLNPTSASRVASLMKEKFGDSGLTFEG
ncbi:OLC1v1001770C1 [Oldenlandia corymbosa var. corymbosa]|uniref:Sulfotransferase n=1 Tax=Oldenlandia corymbosa var. corymbosa TaxID=529605 RepID=A0AAV1D7P0_OLDCO|nr:OLC1v1001770C1 [Oldenlandia corymbosa var. corymbosa]